MADEGNNAGTQFGNTNGQSAQNAQEENKNETSHYSNSIITIPRTVKNTGDDSSDEDQQDRDQTPQDDSNSNNQGEAR